MSTCGSWLAYLVHLSLSELAFSFSASNRGHEQLIEINSRDYMAEIGIV